MARMNPARAIDNRNSTSPDWFLDWAFEDVQRLAAGKNEYVLTARTTVDLTLQRQADAAVNAALEQQVLHVPQRQRKADVEHHRKANDLGQGLGVAEGGAFGHAGRLAERHQCLKQSSSDNTLCSAVHPLNWQKSVTKLSRQRASFVISRR